MVLLKSLVIIVVFVGFFSFPQLIKTQFSAEPNSAARDLDSLLQDYAYRALIRPRTGTVYNGTVPENLTGIKVSALRLRSGSFFIRGVKTFEEFQLPIGVSEEPHVERLALVYQNLGNWSEHYYPLPGHTYLASILGLLAYDGKNLSAKNLPELNLRANARPISIKFSDVSSVSNGLVPRCVWFDIQGTANFSNLLPGNICSSSQQGHFSIVVVDSFSNSPSPNLAPQPISTDNDSNIKKGIIVASVFGGLALMVILVYLILAFNRWNHRRQIPESVPPEAGDALHNVAVGGAGEQPGHPARLYPGIAIGRVYV